MCCPANHTAAAVSFPGVRHPFRQVADHVRQPAPFAPQGAIPEAAALLPVLDELAARTGLIWRYDPELGIRARCTAATPTITTGVAGTSGDAWTDDGEPDHLCPVALLAMGGDTERRQSIWRGFGPFMTTPPTAYTTPSGEVVTITHRQN